MYENPNRIFRDARSARRDARTTGRADVDIPASIREPGLGKTAIKVLDLSVTGYRMQCFTRLNHEKLHFMQLPGFAPIEAHIRWQDGDTYGCVFANPLHPAVFDHIASKYPTLLR